jgi:hypothetical protein
VVKLANTPLRSRQPEFYNEKELQFGVGVRADFAVQVDLFVLRGNPFHASCSFAFIEGMRDL